MLTLREVWESETPKNYPGTSKHQCQEVWDSQPLKIFSHLYKNLEWIYVLFSLRMAALLHKWEFKNIEVEFLKVSEKFDHQDFQILKLGSPGTSWFWQLVQALFLSQYLGYYDIIKSYSVFWGYVW